MTNINSDGALAEDPGANGVSSAPLFNPVGTYSGTYTSTGGQPQNFGLSVTSSSGKIFTTVNAGYLEAPPSTDSFQSKINGNHCSVHGKGADLADNISKYSISVTGVFASTMDSISGKINAAGKLDGGSFKIHGIFSVSPIFS